MSNQSPKRGKHIPQRTCIGCRTVQPKRTLIRIVRTAEGVMIDASGKLSGRGAYLHNIRSCWEKALKQGFIARALKTEVTEVDRERLGNFLQTLNEEENSQPPEGSGKK